MTWGLLFLQPLQDHLFPLAFEVEVKITEYVELFMNNAYEKLKQNYLSMLGEMDVIYYDTGKDEATKAIELHGVMSKYSK
jgi:hypothetical protein